MGLECLQAPHRFHKQRSCAQGPTCFDVANCDGGAKNGVPELVLWDMESQFEQRSRYLVGKQRLDGSGSGRFGPDLLHRVLLPQLSAQRSPAVPNSLWVLAPLSYQGFTTIPTGIRR